MCIYSDEISEPVGLHLLGDTMARKVSQTVCIAVLYDLYPTVSLTSVVWIPPEVVEPEATTNARRYDCEVSLRSSVLHLRTKVKGFHQLPRTAESAV